MTKESSVRRRQSPELVLIILILIALLIRIAAAMTRDMIQMDETSYASLARSLAAGHGYVDISGQNNAYYSPLLPIFIAGVAFILRDIVLSGYVVVTVFGALMLLPVYLLTREFAGQRAALLAAALAAVMPIFIDYSSMVYSEGIFSFFLLFAIFFGWQMLRSSRIRCGLAAGLALVMAYLSNPAAMYYLVVLLVLAAAVMAIRKGARWKMAKSAAALLLVFLVFAAPYFLFLHAELGRWTYTGKNVDINLYDASHNLRLGTVEWEKDLLSLVDDKREVKVMTMPKDTDLLAYVVKNPKTAARIFIDQSSVLYSDLFPKVLPLWLLPLLGLGLFARGWDRRRAAEVGYLALMIVPVTLVLAMYAHTRFFIPYLAIAMVWLGLGWEKLEEWGRETIADSVNAPWKHGLARWLPWLIGAALLLPTVAYGGATVYAGKATSEYREAGEWLGANAGEGQRILSRESPSAYYSGGLPVYMPYADYQDTTIYARHQDIDYLVIGRQAILDWRPQLKILLEDDSQHPEWKLVQVIRPGTAQETYIFKLQ